MNQRAHMLRVILQQLRKEEGPENYVLGKFKRKELFRIAHFIYSFHGGDESADEPWMQIREIRDAKH